MSRRRQLLGEREGRRRKRKGKRMIRRRRGERVQGKGGERA